MSLDEIKELDRHILTIDELENLEAEENVLRIEHLGHKINIVNFS